MLINALNFCIDRIVDTVVMNPPFGTRRKGADMDFLLVALKVYSLTELWFVRIPVFRL